METGKKNYLKFVLGLAFCLLVRLIPFRAPNVEPIMAVTMPIGRVYGASAGFSFPVLSILLYDLATRTLGAQTIFTALAYGIVGLLAVLYFKQNKDNKWSYVQFAIYGTLLFDAMTGLTVGPIFFHQSFFNSLVGQIPFTILHLIGNITFAIILSPAIYRLLIKKRQREKILPINILNPKTI